MAQRKAVHRVPILVRAAAENWRVQANPVHQQKGMEPRETANVGRALPVGCFLHQHAGHNRKRFRQCAVLALEKILAGDLLHRTRGLIDRFRNPRRRHHDRRHLHNFFFRIRAQPNRQNDKPNAILQRSHQTQPPWIYDFRDIIAVPAQKVHHPP